MTKIADLKAKTDDELTTELANLKREQFNLRFQAATSRPALEFRICRTQKDSRKAADVTDKRFVKKSL